MQREPWRAQDIPDAILGRNSRLDPPMGFLVDADPEMWADYDAVYVVQWPVQGGVQPALWPMTTHRHTQECFRA